MRQLYLLDTNIVSEFSKPFPDIAIQEKINAYEKFCAISATVWQELIYGFEKMPEGRRKNHIEAFIGDIKDTFPILPYDSFAAQICGELFAKCKALGLPSSFSDTQIAATAIANNLILVTHNTEDFTPFKKVSMLKVEDWKT